MSVGRAVLASRAVLTLWGPTPVHVTLGISWPRMDAHVKVVSCILNIYILTYSLFSHASRAVLTLWGPTPAHVTPGIS